ncbi:hypothetical protein ACJRO7_009277 [Eucalyptus globulus]|uniref:CMP/dCMP-type deaminase domain-containing protein n=1 Tax=Eucalyptus globulus TaxID=34317 RepID=A0ABD3L856_EUCGL
MNGREVSLVTSATLFGALASAVALGFLFTFDPLKKTKNKNKYSSSSSSSINQHERSSSPPPLSKPCPFDPSKRHGYLSWDDYFMAIAFLSAERSKDPNRQVGACLVSQNGIILAPENCCHKFLTTVLRQGLATMDFPEVVLMTSFLGPRNPNLEILWRQNTHMCVMLRSMLSSTQTTLLLLDRSFM